MSVEIFDVEQGSVEWLECRRGIPTASRFKDILAESADLAMRKKYRRQLADERYTGLVKEGFSSKDMERGKEQEPKIRAAYAFMTGSQLQQVGFARRGIAGCSPDSLISGAKGFLEIKSAEPHILIGYIEDNKFPSAHKAQCQGGLWVMEYDYVDIAIGWCPDPPLARPYPVFIKRAFRDESYIATIALHVEKFDREVGATLETINRYVPD